ncbi:MAG: glycosyltransferase family A protein [Nitrososphaeria archaeon]
MKFDVVVPTRKMENITSSLLKFLKEDPHVGQIIITEETPLSIARKKACLRAETEWVAMFDDDMIIPHNWFDIVSKHIGEDIGAVSTVAIEGNIHLRAYQLVVSNLLKLENIDTALYINNVLIRKEIMMDYNPPPLFLSEDMFLKKHVEKKGYKWKVIPTIGAIHLSKIKSGLEIGVAYKRYKHYNYYQLLRRLIAHFLLSPFAILYTKKFSTLLILWKNNVEFLLGWIKG